MEEETNFDERNDITEFYRTFCGRLAGWAGVLALAEMLAKQEKQRSVLEDGYTSIYYTQMAKYK